MRRTRLSPEDRPLCLPQVLPTPEELRQYGLKKLCSFVAAHTSDEIGDLFHENAVDGSSFLHLDAEELSRMGIREAGTRVKISRLIHDVSSADEALLHGNPPAMSWEGGVRGAPRSAIPPALQPLSSRHPLPYTPRTAALGEAFTSPLSPSIVCDTPTARFRSANKMLGADGFDGVSLSGTTEPYQKKRFSEHVKRIKHESSKTPLHHHMWGTLHRAEAIPGSEEYWEARYQKLDEISADAMRWIEFVEEREDNRGGEETFAWGDFKVSAKLEEKTSQLDLNEMYDLTAERLEQLFIRFDNDDDGFMAIYELGRALKHQGLGRLDPKLKQIFQAVAAPNEWRLTVPEFSVALTCLKLAELFVHAHQSELGSMSVLDFDSDTAHFTKHVKDYSHFFFGHRAEGAVRWIHVTKPTKTLLLLLSVKYRLHPLGVEDAMEATDNMRVPTKFDRYGAHFFLQVNYFFLENTDFEKDDRITFNTSEIGMFVAGAPQWDTVITIIHGPSPKDRGRHRRNLDASDVDNNNLDVWESIQKKLQSTHARSRENKSDFLMYDLLTVCLNELKPIVQAYRRRLSEFHELLLQAKCGFPEEKLTELSWVLLLFIVSWDCAFTASVAKDVHTCAHNAPRLPQIALELGDLHRNLRPVKHVIRQVNEENSITPQCKLYLSNLHEDIEQVRMRIRPHTAHTAREASKQPPTQANTATHRLCTTSLSCATPARAWPTTTTASRNSASTTRWASSQWPAPSSCLPST